MTIDNLEQYIYTPSAIQSKILSELEKGLNEELEITDPTNPFMFLLESNSIVTASAMQEVARNVKKMYPQLATEKEDLYHHLTNNEIDDIFASPSHGTFRFFINLDNLLSFGFDNGNYVEIMIPKFTSVTVNDYKFLLVNDIIVRYYKSSKKPFVKLIGNESLISKDKNILIPSGIITDNTFKEWIMFELDLQQLEYTEILDSIIESKPFYREIAITNRFVYADIYKITDTGLNPINKTYSNFVYNPDKVTMYLRPLEDKLILEMPMVYIMDGSGVGNIKIDLFTSHGELNIPLFEYNQDDFKIEYPKNMTSSNNTQGLNSISILIQGIGNTYGGRNELSFQELKEKIVMHSTGDNVLPITESEIKEELGKLGFSLYGKIDTLLNRNYIITKEIGDLGYDVNTLPDIFSDMVKFTAQDIDDVFIKIRNQSLIINPFIILKLEDGIISRLSNTEIEEFYTNLDLNQKLNITKGDTKYFYTIYKYVADFKDTLKIRAYDINEPTILNNRDIIVNDTINSLITTDNFTVSRLKDDYIIRFYINPDDNFKSLTVDKIKLQLDLINKYGNKFSYFGYVEDLGDKYLGTVVINTTGLIDEENMIELNNFVSNITVGSIELYSKANLIIYYEDKLVNDTDTIINKYMINDGTGLYMETFDIELGKFLKYLYTNYDVTYTTRKYKTYEEDVYLTYEEDVYELDDTGTPVVEYIDTNGDGVYDDIQFKILHKKGDIVYDEDGNPIIKHKKGDVILDENGEPILDPVLGMEHLVELLMLEFPIRLATNAYYAEYRIAVYKELTNIVTVELEDINNRLLENTKALYKPRNNLKDVKLIKNGIIYISKNFVTPDVTLYIEDTNMDLDLTKYKPIINKILQDGLRKNLRISVIEDTIAKNLGENVISVKIKNLDTVGDIEVKTYTPDSSRIVINKLLTLDNSGQLLPDLDININVVGI